MTGLKVARALGGENVVFKSDSQLVIGQVRREYEAKEARMQKYLKLTHQLISSFNYVEFVQIPRDQNVEADEVAQSASTDNQSKRFDWKMEEQNYPSIQELQTFSVHTGHGWTSLILSFLREGRLSSDPEEAKKVRKRAARFTILNDELYKRGYS